jgi:hypothetical protein
MQPSPSGLAVNVALPSTAGASSTMWLTAAALGAR